MKRAISILTVVLTAAAVTVVVSLQDESALAVRMQHVPSFPALASPSVPLIAEPPPLHANPLIQVQEVTIVGRL